MDIKTIKINRRSANITEGKSRAPNRSMYYAMGYEENDFVKPMIGVANGHSTITPCNSGLQKLADAAIAAIDDAIKRGLIINFNISRPNDESPSTITFEAKQRLV